MYTCTYTYKSAYIYIKQKNNWNPVFTQYSYVSYVCDISAFLVYVYVCMYESYMGVFTWNTSLLTYMYLFTYTGHVNGSTKTVIIDHNS